MITVLSPSKTQDFSDNFSHTARQQTHSEPELLQEATLLAGKLKKKSPNDIRKLMEVSANLANLNYERFQKFSPPFTRENARQALLAFKGDVYTDIDVEHYSKNDFGFAQEHLRILSGLYGLLRPMDLIQPYRLEMRIKLKSPKGKNLYEFWNGKITTKLNQAFQQHTEKTLVNLASNEYFKAIDTKKLNASVVTPVFKEFKNGSYKVIALFAKKARGAMADFIIKNQIDEPQQLKLFSKSQYEYSENQSSESEWVFVR